MEFIRGNKFTIFITLCYVVLMISIIDWGIPNLSHPFNYQMDEWHQLQAIRATFENFSANVPGSAHGTMFHFILSGLYLIPFFALHIINPFIIKSSTEFLNVQQSLFEILRINTFLFGAFSIIVIAKIARDYLRVNSSVSAILFVFSPLWLSLGNYFKYDIALVFWISLSLLYLFKFGSRPTLKNYLIAGIFCGLGVATKISALPILIVYIVSFFVFSQKINFRNLFFGQLVFFITVIFLGTPDLVLGKGSYKEFLYSNLVSGSNGFENLLTEFGSWWQYLYFKIFPIDFGYGFFAVYVFGIIYWIFLSIKYLLKKTQLYKNEFFLLFCFLMFLLSLIPLRVGASGNRLLVLLPFFALLSASFLKKITKNLNIPRLQMSILITLIVVIQVFQSMTTVFIKWLPDVRQTSSVWIEKNIKKGSLIGIENIPIYQLLPDVAVREFYSEEKATNNFKYEVIHASSKNLPSVIIITNRYLEYDYFKISSKKKLLDRLKQEEYKEVVNFKPPEILYTFIGNDLNFFISGLVSVPTITIFKKDDKTIYN